MKINTWLASRLGQSLVTVFIILTLFMIFWTSPVNYWSARFTFWDTRPLLLIPFVICLFPFLVYASFLRPYIFCLIFFSFSVFRIHEVFSILLPYQFPFIFSFLGIFSLIINVALGRITLYWQREMSFFLVFFLLVTIGVFLAYDFDISYKFWQDVFLKIFIVFFLVVWTIGDKKEYLWLLRVIISCGIILACITIYNKIYSISLIGGSRASIGEKLSTLNDPNDLALTLLIPFSFGLSLLVTKSNYIFSRVMGLVSSLLIFQAILATQSRGGLLGLAGVVTYFLSHKIKSKLVLFMLGLLVVIFLYVVANIAHREMGGAVQGIDESSMGRINAWKTAINMAIHHPFFGVGLDGFMSNYYNFAVAWNRTNPAVHSSWFGVLAEAGFPGLFLFILCVYSAMKATRLNIQKIEAMNTITTPQKPVFQIIASGIYSGLIGFCISSTFLSQGFTWPFYIFFALSICLTHSTKNLLKRYNDKTI